MPAIIKILTVGNPPAATSWLANSHLLTPRQRQVLSGKWLFRLTVQFPHFISYLFCEAVNQKLRFEVSLNLFGLLSHNCTKLISFPTEGSNRIRKRGGGTRLPFVDATQAVGVSLSGNDVRPLLCLWLTGFRWVLSKLGLFQLESLLGSQ